MFAAEVIGTVVATQKQEGLSGRKLLIVRKLDPDGEITDDELVAVDTVGAGVGERVLVLAEGGSASMTMGVKKPPTNVVIVGIIDAMSFESYGRGQQKGH
ncbi:EutN/CcmL family microcompartment protein [bacterium]|nr:EutN/CcmL family microcompartment protein [bacterium]